MALLHTLGPGRPQLLSPRSPCALEPASHSYWAPELQLPTPVCLEPVLRKERSPTTVRSLHTHCSCSLLLRALSFRIAPLHTFLLRLNAAQFLNHWTNPIRSLKYIQLNFAFKHFGGNDGIQSRFLPTQDEKQTHWYLWILGVFRLSMGKFHG